MKKDITLVHLITSLKIGGAESWLVDLISNLPQGIKHHVIYFYDGPNRHLLEQKGIKTYNIKGLLKLYDPIFWWRTYRLLKNINPDLIHSSLWSANLIGRMCARLLKIPIICSIHLGFDQDGKIRNYLDRFTLNWAQCLVPVSQVVADSFVHIKWIEKRKLNPIKNGIDMHRIIPATLDISISRSSLNIPNHAFVFGSVGRFIERKNYHWLIQCFATIHSKYPEAHLLLLGIGPQEQELRNLVAELHLKNYVHFVIGQPANRYLALMDCFVLPSKQEGLSIALLEAMCHKKPCIITSPDGRHDAIRHKENGLIIPLRSESLIDACSLIIENPTLRHTLETNAYDSIQRDFNIKRMVDQYLFVYKQILKENLI